jgi:hypothetical protein
MNATFFLSYRRDAASAAAHRLRARLVDRLGSTAVFDAQHDIAPGTDVEPAVDDAIRRCDGMLVLIDPAWLSSADAQGRRRLDDPDDPVRHQISLALASGKRVVPLLLDGAGMPPASALPDELRALVMRQAIRLDGRQFDRDVEMLIDQLGAKPGSVRRMPGPARQNSGLRGAARAARILTGTVAGAVAGTAASVLAGLKSVFSTAGHLPGSAPPTPPPPAKATPSPPPAAAQDDPVMLGVTAPGSCAPGARFNAVLAVYVASVRASTEAKLRRLGGQGTEPLLDLAPDRQAGWRVGAPVTVRLTATHAQVTPTERRFEWNGRENLASFDVRVGPDAPEGELDLCFHVALADVPIACIPLPVSLVSTDPAPAAPRPRSVRTATSAFASYSSKDAQVVGYCLSALARWSPGLAIFQDCLDLNPNEAFKPQLSQHIADSDVFLLFWSRHASASPWVHWEYDTARKAHGLDAVLPMPLEDPRIAPPPPEFADAHMRDRFMMARYALARIDEVAAAKPP